MAHLNWTPDLETGIREIDGQHKRIVDFINDLHAEAAAAAGLSEIDFCDRTVATFQNAWKNLDIEYNDFIRTTSDRHKAGVRKILDAMRTAKTQAGEDVVYSAYYEGLYCQGCEKFLTEKELVDGLCPYHKTPPQKLKEKNYFFRLTAFAGELKRRIESGELKILPEGRGPKYSV